MYTKNPVTGKNETIVNTSMLKGAVDGVTTKIAGKADKGALDSLSTYTEGVKASVAGKADKSAVTAVSAYATGMLPKDVYAPLVDAYVGLACKVADPDVLEGAAKMAFAANPVKYATSNPDDARCAEVTRDTYDAGNPIYVAVTAAGSTVELPPFLRLKRWSGDGVGVGITSWKTELPNLTNGQSMFYQCSGLTSWTVELPNLTNGSNMFDSTGLTSWTTELPNLVNGSYMFLTGCLESFNVELPNLTNGYYMFNQEHTAFADEPTFLKHFRGTLPSLVNGYMMFSGCQLDIESVRCIAETINDVNDLQDGGIVQKEIDLDVGYDVETELEHERYAEQIKDKGWTLVINSVTA